MSLIKNLVKEPEHKPIKKKKSNQNDDADQDSEEPVKLRPTIKSATDLQRLRLEKLMKNPSKQVVIPEPRKEKDLMQSVPSFVRNVMGSSAGAGSGEFHVYRHLRRKEYARQKVIQLKSHKEELDDQFQLKLEDNRRIAEEKTAKKRAKRLKKKKNLKGKKPKREATENEDEKQVNSHTDSSDPDEDESTPVKEIKSIENVADNSSIIAETAEGKADENVELPHTVPKVTETQ